MTGPNDSRGRPPAQRPGASLRVLLAEDDPVVQELLTEILTSAGYQTIVASSGREAVALHKNERVDVVLMDIHMPGMDGLTATEHIRAQDRITGRHTPVVAITASAVYADRERCLAAGMDSYLVKPIRVEELFQMLEVFAKKRGEAGFERAGRELSAASTMDPPAERELKVFDRAEALQHCLGNAPLLDQMVKRFAEELPRAKDALQRALSNKDMERLAKGAHKLKGAAANLAAWQVHHAAEELEGAARSGETDGARARWNQLSTAIDSLTGRLQEEMERTKPSSGST